MAMDVLLVEDNPDDAELTLMALRDCEAVGELVHALDGAQALEYILAGGPRACRNGARLPKVVVLDLKLPKLDGLEVLRRIRSDERTRRLPVVVLSSSDQESDLRRCYEQGVNSYVVKPVGFEEYLERVSQLGRYWLALNRTQRPEADTEPPASRV
ncbi:MAG: response regulator [Burkholderiales bacterium]|nr:response regulator [Burkholderiales bacterium]